MFTCVLCCVPILVSEPVGTHGSFKLREKFPNYSKGSIPEVSVTNGESHDGRNERKYTDGKNPIMWIITEDNTWVQGSPQGVVGGRGLGGVVTTSSYFLCAGTVWIPAAHYIIPRVWFMQKCTNGVCIVVRQTVALERTLVTVEYEEKRMGQCTAPDKMLQFCVEIIVIASGIAALGRLKSFASMFFL